MAYFTMKTKIKLREQDYFAQIKIKQYLYPVNNCLVVMKGCGEADCKMLLPL
jgi:hypothetical protein